MEELRSLARNDVFILGAGFSKAVATNFPLAADLLEPIRSRLHDRLGMEVQPRGGEGFEQWLSRLAEDQPYLPPDTNLERAAAFQRVSKEVGKILTDHENAALGNSEPEWLAKLIATWHIRQATVISFNYDNLVEAAVQTQQSWLHVTTHDILRQLPPLPPRLMREEDPPSILKNLGRASYVTNPPVQVAPAQTFRLLKLHGSISWYWDDGDNGGATLQRWPYIGQFLEPVGDQTDDIARQFPGRVPFIAPPSATKSKYLGNRVLRDFWREALYALQNAENIYFLGYSVPPQDQAAMGLIIEGIGDRTPSPAITVVDKRSTKVIDNLASLLLPNDKADGESTAKKQAKIRDQLSTNYSVKQHRGDSALRVFSREYFHELKSHAVESLNDFALHLEYEVDPNEPETLLMHGELDVVPRPRADAGLRLCSDHMTVKNLGGSTLVIPFDSCHQLPDGEGISKLMGKLLSHECTQLVVRYTDPASNKVHDFPVVDHRLELRPANMYGEGYYMLSLSIFNTQQAPLNYRPEVVADLKAP
ncbi:hypothetical protein [Ferrimicrobium sp.]|uniref:hypothetical protein n=1 Tax=Ferrimicrobium sp. TaxID=2926050 RepID=UPI00262040B3|nr:hypothetical protein [Ferrimicrobium sp.]